MASTRHGYQPFSKSFSLPGPRWGALDNPQTAALSGGVHWSVLWDLQDFAGDMGLVITLNKGIGAVAGVESYVTASTNAAMGTDTPHTKAWFLVGCGVEVVAKPDSGTASLAVHGPANSPYTVNLNSGMSINAGFFGDDATGGLGFSNSISTPYKEILYTDATSGSTLRTLQTLGLTSGGAFLFGSTAPSWAQVCTDIPGSLYYDLQGAMFTSGPFIEPHDPAPISYQNQLLPSQGAWLLPASFRGTVAVTVKFSMLLAAAHTAVLQTPDMKRLTYDLKFLVDLTNYKPPTAP